MENLSSLIPLSQVTATALTVIKTATTEDRLLMETWCYLGVRDIGPNEHWLRSCTLYNQDNSFIKPNDFIKLVSLVPVDERGFAVSYQYRAGAPDRQVETEDMRRLAATYDSGRVDISEDSYAFHVSNNLYVAGLKLRYLALPVDESSELQIPEYYQTPLVAFCVYMWELRQRENQSAIELARQEWVRQRERARGRAGTPSYEAMVAIGAGWNSMFRSGPLRPNF